ncbi:hypothetical protein B0I32_115325 [Nonomuraea fuscirosea]|uniref:Uncharacterized protein n=1 Tax=Nonomuraea fuscirosea TaxID=1291556 RepID=A0A2T0MSM4_9ACTN|nr:hypothetical protein B0I32_115325 [Nonomuraea fuscirosea]
MAKALMSLAQESGPANVGHPLEGPAPRAFVTFKAL